MEQIRRRMFTIIQLFIEVVQRFDTKLTKNSPSKAMPTRFQQNQGGLRFSAYLAKSFLSTRMRMMITKPSSSTTSTSELMIDNQWISNVFGKNE